MILIIDSEKTAASNIKLRFDELALQNIEIVNTAQQARDWLEEFDAGRQAISLIIIDSELEDAASLELCKEFRLADKTKSAHIMMVVSSIKNKTAIENARHNGASGIFVKPYSAENLSKFLAAYIQKKSVLLVDDDPVIRKMVSKILLELKVELIEIDNGITANNLLNTMLPPAVVLMDIGLPGMNGIQLVSKIRVINKWKSCPILMLTSSTDVADVKKSLTAGANDYVAKPFKVDDFKKRVFRYLTNAG